MLRDNGPIDKGMNGLTEEHFPISNIFHFYQNHKLLQGFAAHCTLKHIIGLGLIIILASANHGPLVEAKISITQV